MKVRLFARTADENVQEAPLASGLPLLLAVIALSTLVEAGATLLLLTVVRLLLITLALILAWNLLKGALVFKRSGLTAPIALFLVLAVISTAFLSPYKNAGLQWLVNIVGYVILFYSVVMLAKGAEWRLRLVYHCIVIGNAVAAYGIVQRLYTDSSRVQGTFSNPNYLAGYLAALCCVSAALVLFEPESKRKILPALSFCMMLSAILLTGSRGAAVALAVGLSCVLWFKFKAKALYIMAGAILLFMLIPNPLMDRMKNVSEGDVYAYSRLDIWKEGAAMLRDHPAGVGMGMYGYYSRQYNLPNEKAIARYGRYAESAHNQYLQVGTELGIAGIVIYLFGMFMLMRESKKACRAADGLSRGVIGGLVAGALVAFTHGLVETNLRSPAIAVLLVLTGGLIVAMRQENTTEGGNICNLPFIPSRRHYVFLGCIACLCALIVVKYAAAYYIAGHGDDLRKQGDIDSAIKTYGYSMLLEGGATRYYTERAASHFVKLKSTGNPNWAKDVLIDLHQAQELNPVDANLLRLEAKVYKFLADAAGEDMTRHAMLERARGFFEKALALDPYNAADHHEVAKICLALGLNEVAAERLLRLQKMEPNYLPGRMSLARAYRSLTKYDLASREYQAILAIKNKLRGVPYSSPVEEWFMAVDEGLIKKELASLNATKRSSLARARHFSQIYTSAD